MWSVAHKSYLKQLPYVSSVDSNLSIVENTVNPILVETFAYQESESAAPLQVLTETAGIVWIFAFEEVGVKERVKTILNYKKPAFWITVAAIVVCIIIAVCFLTNPAKEYQVRITIPAGSTEAICYSEEEAVEIVRMQLIQAYENRYGTFEASDIQPTIYSGDEERLAYIIPRLAVSEITEDFYVIPVIWDFRVYKDTGKVTVYYNGIDPFEYEFDPNNPQHLTFAG